VVPVVDEDDVPESWETLKIVARGVRVEGGPCGMDEDNVPDS